MGTYNIGSCGCCGSAPCDPVSFRFLSFVMDFAYEYDDPPWNTVWKTTQWRVEFPNQGNVDSYTGTLEDATSVTSSEFR